MNQNGYSKSNRTFRSTIDGEKQLVSLFFSFASRAAQGLARLAAFGLLTPSNIKTKALDPFSDWILD